MTDRPILFSGPMVRALLAGRKTQTRRIIKPRGHACILDGGWTDDYVLDPGNQSWREKFYPYRVGDRLWVRESWAGYTESVKGVPGGCRWVHYQATDEDDFHPGMKWKPLIHMRRSDSRLTLTVTDVRVQRLQEISEADAIAEGISPLPSGRYHCGYDEEGEITCKSPVTAYGWLWNSLNESRGFGWIVNPWVCAVSFAVEHRNIDAEAA